MIKSKRVIYFSALAALLATGLSIAAVKCRDLINVLAQRGLQDVSEYTMTIDKNSGFHFSDDGKGIMFNTAITPNGNEVRFVGCGLTPAEDGLCVMPSAQYNGEADIFFTNVDPINGLKSIKINYTNASIYLDYSRCDTDAVDSSSLSSGNSYTFNNVSYKRPNIFKLTAYSGTATITSIEIKYTCASPVNMFPGIFTVESVEGGCSVTSHKYKSAGTWAHVFSGEINSQPIMSFANSLLSNDVCVNLISFPTNVEFTKIPDSCCSGCERLCYIIIPNNITEIGASAFRNNYSIIDVYIPSSVTVIGMSAFTTSSSRPITINCEATEKPAGWAYNWYTGSNITVNWGVSR